MRRPLVAAAAAVFVVALLVLGLVTGGLTGLARQGLAVAGIAPSSGATPPAALDSTSSRATAAPTATGSSAAPEPSPTPAGLPPNVLAAASADPGTVATEVRARLAAVSDKDVSGRISAEVVDVASGKALYSRGAATALTPASTLKLLTSAAALRLLGSDHRFTTRVVQAKPGVVVIVGGGDPYLTKKKDSSGVRASIADLATLTATALRKQGQTSVRVGYDAGLFSGPAWNPKWPSGYADQVTPTSALWVDEGRLAGGSPGPRTKDPAGDAAAAFAAALRSNGIKVSAIASQSAPSGATTLAQAQSMPLERIVERLLMLSDNDAAEVVLRQTGVAAAKQGSISAGLKAVRQQLAELGLPDAGTATYDGSGLARENTVSAALMAEVLRTAATPQHPELRALITGLPVAGVEGSLRHRYDGDDTELARGLVRGKTGTLRKVHSLAGFVRTEDGSMLTYAFLVNDPPNDYAAVVWLEKVTAALARCGCR